MNASAGSIRGFIQQTDIHLASLAMRFSCRDGRNDGLEATVRTDIRSLGSVRSTVTASEQASERTSGSTMIDSVAPRRS